MLLAFSVAIFLTSGHQKESKYIVDFDPLLGTIITETKYVEQLGFIVPDLARNIALQVDQSVVEGFKSKIMWQFPFFFAFIVFRCIFFSFALGLRCLT